MGMILLRDAVSESELPFRVDFLDWAATSPSFRQAFEKDFVDLA
jgi:hypothetical protein